MNYPLSRTSSNALAATPISEPLTRRDSGAGNNFLMPLSKRDSIGHESLGRRPSTAGSFGAGGAVRSQTPVSVSIEGSRVREMMKQRLTRQLSNHRRTSVVQQEASVAEFQRRHGVVVMRQHSRAMFHLFRRKARALSHIIYWFRAWKREIESRVRTEDWYLLSEQMLSDSSHKNELEAITASRGEFVKLIPVGGDVLQPTSFIELRFNKNDFSVDRKSHDSCLSADARKTLLKEPEARLPDEILEVVRCLKKLKSFHRFPLQLQKEIARVGVFDCYERNRVLSRAGRRAEGWYFVLFGKLILRPKTSSGTTENKFVGVGQMFGEDEVVLDLPRTYTAVTREDNTEVLYIYREDYLEAKDRLEGRCRIDDVRRTFSANPTLQHFNFDMLNTKKKAWQAVSYQPGTIIANHANEGETNRNANDELNKEAKVKNNFTVSNLTVSDLISDHLLEKEKSKYFCVVQKGSADIYGVCQESAERKAERQASDPFKKQMRLLKMLHPDENEWRKMNKHCVDNSDSTNGLMLLLPEKWNKNAACASVEGKVPRRFQRSTPFTSDPEIQREITMAPVGYDEIKPDDPPPIFIDVHPEPEKPVEVEKTFAKIGRAEAGTVFGMESAVSAALEPWVRDRETGARAKAIGVNQPPDIYFVSNGCQIILVDKDIYNKGLERDAKCLNASQMPTYHDKISILNTKEDTEAYLAQKDEMRAHYRKIMANSKKISTRI